MTKKGILLHHWDTDGICSCVILQRELEKQGKALEWTHFTPHLGNYFLTEEEMDMFRNGGFSEAYFVDMAIPSEQVAEVAKHVDHLTHFDHHIQEPHKADNITHINPVSKGSTQADYPACTYVLREHFKRELDLPTVLGVVGDLENRIFRYEKVMPEFDRYLKGRGFSLYDIMRMCELVDSNYKIDDRKGVMEAVKVLYDCGEDPGPILSNQAWIKKAKAIQNEIHGWIKRPYEDMDGTKILRIETTSHIISTVGRRSVQQVGGTVVVINTGLDHMDQIYARGANMKDAIAYCRELGLRAGGKNDVVGAILPKGKVEEFIKPFLKTIPQR